MALPNEKRHKVVTLRLGANYVVDMQLATMVDSEDLCNVRPKSLYLGMAEIPVAFVMMRSEGIVDKCPDLDLPPWYPWWRFPQGAVCFGRCLPPVCADFLSCSFDFLERRGLEIALFSEQGACGCIKHRPCRSSPSSFPRPRVAQSSSEGFSLSL